MNQPAVVPAVDPLRRRRKRLIVVAVVGSVLLTGAVVVGFFSMAMGMIERSAARPWAVLHELSVVAQTEGGAETFYRKHPRLAGRYPTSAAFVESSRVWAPRLAAWPATVPSLWSMIKSGGGSFNISSSGGRTQFTMNGYRGLSVEMVLQDGQLADLEIQ